MQSAIHDGIINLEDLQTKVEMAKRQRILEQHEYKIWHGNDGKWKTYIPDSSVSYNRKLIKRNTKKALEDYLVNFYGNDKSPTFGDYYTKWREVQDKLVTDNSIYKYNTDFNRFFKESPLLDTKITMITEDMLKVYFHDMIVQYKLPKTAFKHLYGYVRNTISKACRDKIMDDDPMKYMTCKQFYKYCPKTEKVIDKQVITQENLTLILDRLYDDYKKKPNYIPNYAIELAYLTGMRVGEVVALQWKHIDFERGFVLIENSEKFNRLTKEYIISDTKNGQQRIFPLDDELRRFFIKTKQVQEEYGYQSQWVFANENGRIHAPMVSSCLKNKCKSIGIDPTGKGIHALRKTLNSNLRCKGVSDVIAASLLGHSVQVNREYYTFDISSLVDKQNAISTIRNV